MRKAWILAPVLLATNAAAPQSIAVDNTYVYWVNADGTIRRVHK